MLSISVILASGVYVVFQHAGRTNTTVAQQTETTTVAQEQTTSASTPTPSKQEPTSASKDLTKTTPSTPIVAPDGQYVDGTYTGTQVNAYYGWVQVRVGVTNGKIASVDFLQYPNDRATSQYINSQAMPLLRQEAIRVQSASVSGVSGATYTSNAFKKSLADALLQAKT